MGRIRIYDGTGLADYESAQWDGEVVIDLDESRASRNDTPPLDSLAAMAGAVSNGGDPAGTATGSGGPTDTATGGGSERTPRDELRAVAGTALTLVGVGIGLAFGFGVFAPGSTPFERALSVGLLVPYYLVCTRGTLWILDDAAALAAAGASWRPNPWAYVAGGGAVVAVGLGWILDGPAAITAEYVPVAAGVVLVALPLAAIVAGPVYLQVRSRRLEQPRASGGDSRPH